MSADNVDDNSLVTCGSLSLNLGEEWKNWCVEDPDWESDVWAKDGRMSELDLLQMKQVLGSPSEKSFDPFWTQHIRTIR